MAVGIAALVAVGSLALAVGIAALVALDIAAFALSLSALVVVGIAALVAALGVLQLVLGGLVSPVPAPLRVVPHNFRRTSRLARQECRTFHILLRPRISPSSVQLEFQNLTNCVVKQLLMA